MTEERTELQTRILNSKNTVFDAINYGKAHGMPTGTTDEIKLAENQMIACAGIKFRSIPGTGNR